MYKFRLIGYRTDFVAYRLFVNADGVECVYGTTTDGRLQTTARLTDVCWANSICPMHMMERADV